MLTSVSDGCLQACQAGCSQHITWYHVHWECLSCVENTVYKHLKNVTCKVASESLCDV